MGAFGNAVGKQRMINPKVPFGIIAVVLMGVLAGQMTYKWRRDIIFTTIVTVVGALVGIWVSTLPFMSNLFSGIYGMQVVEGASVSPNWFLGNTQAQVIGTLLVVIFCYLGSVLPIWSYAQPVNYVSFWIVSLGVVCRMIGLVIWHPGMGDFPAFTQFTTASGPLWPILFITIACGAVSGWHSLVSSSGTARQLEKETDALPVGGGAMFMETDLAGFDQSSTLPQQPARSGRFRQADPCSGSPEPGGLRDRYQRDHREIQGRADGKDPMVSQVRRHQDQGRRVCGVSDHGWIYIIAFGALSYLRRQGLALRFALEGLLITAVAVGLVFLAVPVSPLLFFVVLYLVTMRIRLLADLGNLFLSRGQHNQALAVYRIALRLVPDTTDRRIVLINRGATQLRMQEPEVARLTLEEALAGDPARVGAKYLAAGYYNLGVACERTGREAEAVRFFSQVIDILPNSLYSRAAQEALKHRRAGKTE
jgi:hypothetical protein